MFNKNWLREQGFTETEQRTIMSMLRSSNVMGHEKMVRVNYHNNRWGIESSGLICMTHHNESEVMEYCLKKLDMKNKRVNVLLWRKLYEALKAKDA